MERPKQDDNVIVGTIELPGSSHSQQALNHEKHRDILVASSWPKDPVPLVPDTKDRIFMWLYDGILLAVPLVLVAKIGLVIGAWKLDRQHRGDEIDLVSRLTTFLIEFNGQMTTAFTIVFVTIISTLVRRYALWKAQTGARVSDLEQLQGSISLPSTLKLIWSLRAFTTMSAALVAIWSFYYLGSQASKQEFQRVDSRSYHQINGYTASTSLQSGFSSSYGNTYHSFSIDDLNAALIAAVSFTKPDYNSPTATPKGTDSIGSAVVPDLNAILDQGWWVNDIGYVSPRPSRHGWVNVAHQSQLMKSDDYSAFIGRATYFELSSDAYGPIFQQINGFLGEYTLPTRYLAVKCARPIILPYETFPDGTYMNQSVSLNLTHVRPDAPKDGEGYPLREFNLSTRWIPDNDQSIVSYGSSRQTCNITYVKVDMQVHCGVSGCFPIKMRYKNNMSRQNVTSFSTPFDDDAFAERFFSALLLSRGAQRNASTTTDIGGSLTLGLQNFLGQPEGSIGEGDNYDQFLSTQQRGLELPLTQYFNTYYILSQVVTGVAPSYAPDDTQFQALPIHGALYDPHYAILWGWIAVDFVSCIILLIAAIIACWLRIHTLAPDIFGYVSSLTRDNPHVALPDNGTTLNGLERARLLRNVKVKIGDVSSPDEESGRVGLAQVYTTRGTLVANLKPTVAYV
ncbi:uncharacterized protein A1O5_02871 [Cladophialophora psammophila CBS 110553]|uniref:Uncharacterized protein n=1 Tax=Cladophialophora psammophila CBS 110553 TaxID=1182543 RepID=W9XB73_9EURO|nr:uncharacterized protein A1O5_02871 [Cladophialophora psammophila CBS 110553]EXJ74575.1 hypothetical protein A1O5_02871 [Cladophialophora psammophila CBS 110553]